MQVELANNLRKLEALYSQHQREQHRLRDRLKWLEKTEERLAVAEAAYAENIRCRDANTRIVTEKDKEKILVELHIDGKVLKAKDNEKMRDQLIGGVKEVTRNASAKVLFGTYRGFDVHIERMSKLMGGSDGFRLTLKGAGGQEFKPNNLIYSFDEKFSLSGLFQRIDNFLAKGLDESITVHRDKARQEQAELETVKAAMGKEFSQKKELALTRENHSAVIRELQRMQDQPGYVSTWTPKTAYWNVVERSPQPGYVSTWTPKTASEDDVPAVPPNMNEVQEEPKVPVSDDSVVPENPPAKKEALYQKVAYSDKDGTSEYSVSNQHNGHILDGFIVRRTFFNRQVGSLGRSLYDDGRWYTTATAPAGLGLRQFATQEEALQIARRDAAERGLQAAESKASENNYHAGCKMPDSMPPARIFTEKTNTAPS